MGRKLYASSSLRETEKSRIQMDADPGSPECKLEEYRSDKGISLNYMLLAILP